MVQGRGRGGGARRRQRSQKSLLPGLQLGQRVHLAALQKSEGQQQQQRHLFFSRIFPDERKRELPLPFCVNSGCSPLARSEPAWLVRPWKRRSQPSSWRAVASACAATRGKSARAGAAHCRRSSPDH